MHENFRLTKRDTWIARIWQMLGDLDEAISTSPLEHLERRVVAPAREQNKSAKYKTMK